MIAAGSLLEFALEDKGLSMPVGRIESLYLGPMTFLEFLSAVGRDDLVSLLLHPEMGRPGPMAHEALRSLLDAVPAAVGRKLKYSAALPEARAAETARALDLLCQAGVAHKVCHSDASGPPLGAESHPKVFKTLILDIGLMNCLMGIRDIPWDDFLRDRAVHEGSMAEHFVGQQLLWGGSIRIKPFLFYWLREERAGNAEVDYLLAGPKGILPVEVKSGSAGSMRSLHLFVSAKRCPLALRLDANPPSFQRIDQPDPGEPPVAYDLVSLPPYMAGVHELWMEAMHSGILSP